MTDVYLVTHPDWKPSQEVSPHLVFALQQLISAAQASELDWIVAQGHVRELLPLLLGMSCGLPESRIDIFPYADLRAHSPPGKLRAAFHQGLSRLLDHARPSSMALVMVPEWTFREIERL